MWSFSMQSTLFDLLMAKKAAGGSSRTSPESSATTGTHSDVSWQDWSDSTPPSFLQAGTAGGRARVWLMDPADAPHGAYSTPSTTAWPSAESASLCYLAEVLEAGPLPTRYSLSSRACSGILARAERRGKKLPEAFRQVLAQIAAKAPGTQDGLLEEDEAIWDEEEESNSPSGSEATDPYPAPSAPPPEASAPPTSTASEDTSRKAPARSLQDAYTGQLVGERRCFSVVPESGQGADLRASEVEVAPAVTTEEAKTIDRGVRIVEPVAFKPSHYTRGKDGAPSTVAPPFTADADKGDQDAVVLAPRSVALRGREGGNLPELAGPDEPAHAVRSASGGSSAPMVMAPVGVDLYNADTTGDIAGTAGAMMQRGNTGPAVMEPIPFDPQQITHPENRSQPAPGRECHTLCVRNAAMASVVVEWSVRRFTPREVERLQGFPTVVKLEASMMTRDELCVAVLANGDVKVDAVAGRVWTTRGPGGVPRPEPLELGLGARVKGYKVANIHCGEVNKQIRLHRLIWISVHGIPPDGQVVDHINNDKGDMRIENLQLLTGKENSRKAADDGLYPESPTQKLDIEMRQQVLHDYFAGKGTYRALAEKYGITYGRVGQIVRETDYTLIPVARRKAIEDDYKAYLKQQCPDLTDEELQLLAKDGPRYRALGNSIAVTVLRELAKSIERERQRR
jgi:site-specific DNA-cytosine methylase